MQILLDILPLPDGLEEEDGGGDGDVEGVEGAEHRDADVDALRADLAAYTVNQWGNARAAQYWPGSYQN